MKSRFKRVNHSTYLAKILFSLIFCSCASADIQFNRVEELPTELRREIGFFEGKRHERLDFHQLKFNYGKEGFSTSVPTPHALIYEPNQPPLPVLSRLLNVPEGYEAEAVIKNPVLEESVGEVPMESMGELRVWGPQQTFKIPTRQGFFPQQMVQTKMIRGKLTLQIFPVQYHAQLKKIRVLRQGDVWIRYKAKALVGPEVRTLFPYNAVIVTTEKLRAGAEALAQFQNTVNGISSAVVTVEAIQKVVPPIEESFYPAGYKDTEGKESIVKSFDPATNTGYDFVTARKIAHYLRTRFPDNGSSLRYVTLLGDALQIPPSYYFALKVEDQTKWGVTDQCYSSLDGCLTPQVALGRLPFHSNEEVESYLTKARRFVAEAHLKPTELNLLGGKAFPGSPVYEGELAALALLEMPFANWNGVNKFFRTKFNYNKKALLQIARGESTASFVYAVDHGEGNRFLIENEAVSSNEIERQVAVMDSFSPVMASVTCSNAAFDEALTREPILFAEKYGKSSVGTALLKHPAGVVAYLGESRPAIGNPVYSFDENGNLDLKGTSHGLQILASFFSHYMKTGKGRLGDAVFSSLSDFSAIAGSEIKTEPNAWSYYITTLLGDPTLVLPERTTFAPNLSLGSSVEKLQDGTPFRELIAPEGAVEVPLHLSLPNRVRTELFRMELSNDFDTPMGEKLIHSEEKIAGNSTLQVPTEEIYSSRVFFLRLENVQGVPRERQVWFNLRK